MEIDLTQFLGLPVKHAPHLDGGIKSVDEDGNETEIHAMKMNGVLLVSKELMEYLEQQCS